MGREAWTQLAQLVDAQHGVVATRQAVALGLSRSTFGRHVREHGWVSMGRGRWAVPGSPDTHERDLWAVSLAADHPTVFTAATALHLMGAVPRRPDAVHVLGPSDRHLDPRGGVCVHRATRTADDVPVLVRGFLCAPPNRAVADHARESTPAALETVIGHLDRLRRTSPASVGAYGEDRGGFHGAPALRVAIARCGVELVHSGAERTARRLLAGAEVPPPHRRPLAIEHGGTIVAEIDLPWPEVRYGVEVDGPDHLRPEAVAADKARDRTLGRLQWMIDRFPVKELRRDPTGFVEQVQAGIRAAAERGVPPWPV